MSDYDVGDVAALRMTLRDPDTNALADTDDVAVTILRPDGTTVGPTAATHPSTGIYTFTVAITMPGVWRYEFDATGAIQAREAGVFVVAEQWSQPVPWAPNLRDVAAYVPTRTVPVDTPGSMTPLGTFDATTVPNDEAVDRLGKAAAAWVSARVGVVDPSLYDMAQSVAAVRAAGFVELAYPVRDAAVNVYDALFAQAAASLEELRQANAAAGEEEPGVGLLPIYNEPDAIPDFDTYSFGF